MAFGILYLPHWWVLWALFALLLVCLVVLCSLIYRLRLMVWPTKSKGSKKTFRTLNWKWLRVGIGSLFLVLFGYFYRDHELKANTFTFTGVTIVHQQSERRYSVLIPGYTEEQHWRFCHPLEMPAKLVDIQFEQRYGCKQVYGVGFVLPHKEKNVQIGRHSKTTAATTYAGLEGKAEGQ